MEKIDELHKYYSGKTVLITGITGFKGSWLAQTLLLLGANVIGVGLKPLKNGSLFNTISLQHDAKVYFCDIRDYSKILNIFKKHKPEVVFHLAAQPIVKTSYSEPKYTYEVNVGGTVNICECIRMTNSVKSFINVTTDKVYLNDENKDHLFREDEFLDGYDPYSNSKSCSELVTHCYYKSFFKQAGIATSTMRAGNVIGGGDFADFRIIPDCFRAIASNSDLNVRNPNSIRPYQYVLEPIFVYLFMAMKQSQNINLSSNYNIGPDESSIITTIDLANRFKHFNEQLNIVCLNPKSSDVHEAAYLKLDNAKIKKTLGYKPVLSIDEAVNFTSLWYKEYLLGKDMKEFTIKQIKEFLSRV